MKWIFMIFLALPTFSYAQFTEKFDDSDFQSNPEWLGNIELFEVNSSGQLHLNAPEMASSAWIFTKSQACENAEWKCDIQMQFDPSSQNYCRIYIIADHPNPELIQNGWFISLGESNDQISLCKITDGIVQNVITGESGRLSLNPVNITVIASCQNSEGWKLQAKIHDSLIVEGTSVEMPNYQCNWYGIYCKYTPTRRNKFYFDNIEVSGNQLSDHQPPQLIGAKFINKCSLQLQFNEPIQSDLLNLQLEPCCELDIIDSNASSSQINIHLKSPLGNNYNGHLNLSNVRDLNGNLMNDTTLSISYIKPTIINSQKSNNTFEMHFSKEMRTTCDQFRNITISPTSTIIDTIYWKDSQSLAIKTQTPFVSHTHYNVHIPSFNDVNGDETDSVTIHFDVITPQRHDIVFSELMTDAEPSVGLPENDYLEIHNRTEFEIPLNGFQLIFNNKSYALPDSTLSPNGWLALVKQGGEILETGSFVLMKTFPSITKSQGEVILISPDEVIMDVLKYDETWQTETFKDEGGWSFEIIDPENRSGNNSNWTYSINNMGGTPGSENSVLAENPDLESPHILFITQTGDSIISIIFQEPISNIQSINSITFSRPTTIDSIVTDTVWKDKVTLFIKTNDVEINELTFKTVPVDYANKPLNAEWYPVQFGPIKKPEQNDVVFNEILFNPLHDDVDYIEIINVSDKTILLNELYITLLNNGIAQNLIQISKEPIPLIPNSEWVLTTDTALTRQHHLCTFPWKMIEMSQFPSMPDDKGNLAITDHLGNVIDQLSYDEDWHHPFINDKEGIALEKISPKSATNNPNYWQSASSLSNHGTPTSKNSQLADILTSDDAHIRIYPEIFTPDMDGNNDELLITTSPKMNGATLTLRIYTKEGKPINELANNIVIGNNETLKWNGTNDLGQRIHPGIYVVWSRIVFSDGTSSEQRLPCVLGIAEH